MSKKKLLLIQLNEINFDLVREYSKDFKFKFFDNEFFRKLLITNSEEKYELLEPWIQWVSIYTGERADSHQIYRLGDIKKYNGETVFNIIEKLSKSIGVVCPMNLENNLKKPKYFFSDPWTKTFSGPGKIIKFISNTISDVVNLNSHKSIPKLLYCKTFIVLLLSFRFKNIYLYLKLIFNFKKKWNKALLLDLMLHDLHIDLIKKHKTDFSSIFFNAGAHIQHHYFFNSQYFRKKNLTNPEWYIKKKHDPILDMILFYDKILSEYKELNDYEVILATGLSQEPYDRVKYYYRLKNHENFFENLNINFLKIEPRMTRDFLVIFKDDNDKNNAIQKLNKLNKINKKEIFSFEDRNNAIFVTLKLHEEVHKNEQILTQDEKKISIKDHIVFVALKNGMHNSKGYFYSTFGESEEVNNITQIDKKIINFFSK